MSTNDPLSRRERQILDILYAKGSATAAEVREATLDVLEKGANNGKGLVLSVGGGTSPGMPRENIVAMKAALDEFNKAHFGSA